MKNRASRFAFFVSLGLHVTIFYFAHTRFSAPAHKNMSVVLGDTPKFQAKRTSTQQERHLTRKKRTKNLAFGGDDSSRSNPNRGNATFVIRDVAESEHNRDYPFYQKRISTDAILEADTLPTLAMLNVPLPVLIRSIGYKRHHKKENSKIGHSQFSSRLVPIKSKAPMLRISESQRKQYLDATIRLAKSEQLSRFFVKYGHFNKNAGDLPCFIRDLYRLNLQRVVFLGEENSPLTAIEYMHESIGKKSILHQLLSRIRKDSHSLFSVELLFILEDIFHTQQLAAAAIISADIQKSTPAERKTIETIIKKYSPKLTAESASTLNSRYQKKRTEILRYIISITPNRYRASDAWFRLGLIEWVDGYRTEDASKMHLAIEFWRKAASIGGHGNLYSKELGDILAAITTKERRISAGSIEKLASIIENKRSLTLLAKTEREKSLLGQR